MKRPQAGVSRRKRAVDIVLTLLTLIVISPVTLALVLVLRISRRGPILARHEAVGLGNRTFKKLSWSRLTVGPRMAEKILAKDLAFVPVLINVLVGDMSLVGPRARSPDHHKSLASIVLAKSIVLQARPGVIGVPGGKNRVAEFRRELAYVENWRLMTDLVIIGQWTWRLFYRDEAL